MGRKIVDLIYERVVALLKQCADNCVPKQKKNFFKKHYSGLGRAALVSSTSLVSTYSTIDHRP